MIQPLNDYVCVKLMAQEEKTSGGLLLPTQNKNAFRLAKVVALNLKETQSLNIGDRVFLDEKQGFLLQHQGEEFLFIKVEHLIAVLKD